MVPLVGLQPGFHNADRRVHLLIASVLMGTLAVAMVEMLSLFSALTFPSALVFWSSVLAACVFLWVRNAKHIQIQFLLPLRDLSKTYLALLVGILVVVLLAALVALLSPPNTWDSLTYHMSRIAHWIQNKSVRHYPTNILRQLYHAPGTEFVILQAQILSGSDRFANLTQWFYYVGCITGASLIAKQVGADSWGQLLAAVVTATLPMAILQASSTQSDLAVSFWLITSVVFLLRLKVQFGWMDACVAGAGIGLAFLTKALAYVYIVPFVIWYAWECLRRQKFLKEAVKAAVAVIILAGLINLGHLTRNYALFHHPLGPLGTINLTNEEMGFKTLLSNVIRGAASHTCFPVVMLNHEITKWVYIVHNQLGMDANNPKTTYAPDFGKFQVRPIHAHEDSAGNPIHFWLIVSCGIACLVNSRIRKNRAVFFYSLATISAYLLLCFIFKWQAWISRLQLPLFIFWAPVIGYVLSLIKLRSVTLTIAGILLVSSLYWSLFNFSRSLLKWPFRDDLPPTIFESSRELLYLNNGANIVKMSYFLVAKYILSRGYRNIGLAIGEDNWEYSYWASLEANKLKIRIEHIEVSNVSGKIKQAPFRPDAIIAYRPSEEQTDRFEREVGPSRELGILTVFGK